MTYEDMILEKQRGGVALLTLNRPQRLNALRWQSWSEIEDALEVMIRDEDVRALVITGSGRAFSAGTDLVAASSDPNPPASTRQARLRALFGSGAKLIAWPVPTIAAVNGVVAGAALSLCLACDIRIASEAARFSAIWSRRGMLADYGGTYLLPRIVGMGHHPGRRGGGQADHRPAGMDPGYRLGHRELRVGKQGPGPDALPDGGSPAGVSNGRHHPPSGGAGPGGGA
jgi:2-(1,2-epoxy-1,2-dihydrophenyl)acetyl-CoA isomerase